MQPANPLCISGMPSTQPRLETATAVLEVNLDAVAANYHFLSQKVAPCVCSVVVKADAYGLGMLPISRRLAQEGATRFFVATVEEGIALRQALPHVTIYVLNSLWKGVEELFETHQLVPVLADLGQIQLWSEFAISKDKTLDAVLQVDTGLIRLGLSLFELEQLTSHAKGLEGLRLHYVMSHLACAYQPWHPYNLEQLERFKKVRSLLPGVPASFSGSGGIFHGKDFWFDMVRPGRLLYGSSFTAEEGFKAAIQPVVRLRARVLQVQTVLPGQSVGYDQTYVAARTCRLATLSLGYADGYMRTLGNKAEVMFQGIKAPVVGRISMDMATVDVTDIPQPLLHPGAWVDIINDQITVDDLAQAAGTVSWEILTRLGNRPRRCYHGEVTC